MVILFINHLKLSDRATLGSAYARILPYVIEDWLSATTKPEEGADFIAFLYPFFPPIRQMRVRGRNLQFSILGASASTSKTEERADFIALTPLVAH